MKAKYYFPTSLEHLTPIIVRSIALVGLIIAIMAISANAASILEPSFETVTQWTYSEVDTNSLRSGGQWVGWATNGTKSYYFTTGTGNMVNGEYAQAAQANVNFTGGNQLIYDYYYDIHNWYTNCRVLIDTNVVANQVSTGTSTGTTKINVTTYSGLHTLKIQFYDSYASGNPWVGSTCAYDNFRFNTIPSVPVTTQHLNYFNSSSTTILWAASTDVDTDTITYNVKVGTTAGGVDVLNYTGDTDTTSNSFTMTPDNSYYYSIRACDPYECSAWSAEKSFGFAVITPYTPTNGSALTKSYPPLTSDVSFTWSEIGGGLSYNLKVAKDINFNLLAVDTTTSNNYSTQALEAGSYWWKVQYYNSSSGTFYNWSSTFNFTLTNTQSISGAGIQGTIYELIGTTQTSLNGATVYIYNSTWSNTQTVGSTGYYLFDGLSNGSVYYVKSILKDYQTSEIETVNVSGIITRNILMKKTEPTDFEPDRLYIFFWAHYKSCTVSCNVNGATVTVYKYGNVLAEDSGITDSVGTIGFRLYKNQLYRVTVVNNSVTLYNGTFYISPTQSIYEIAIGTATIVYPNTSIVPNATTYNYTSAPLNTFWANITNTGLNSTIGLGTTGQGILIGLINWFTVSVGGVFTTTLVCGILVSQGILSIGIVVFYIITLFSLWIITRN